MSNVGFYEVLPTDKFNDDMEFYIRKKKYKNVNKDIKSILDNLKNGIFKGDIISNLKVGDNKTYKVRAVNSNTGQGKSNGYRLIYYVEDKDNIVLLITLYYKKDDGRIPTDKEISELIKRTCFNNYIG